MKKFITLALALIMTASFAGAQSRFGIKAGLNFNTLEDVTQSGSVDNAWKSQTGYHFGIAWQIKVPLLGIALQPELLYSKVKTHIADIPAEGRFSPSSYYVSSQYPQVIIDDTFNPAEIELDYLTLPINIQLGIDMLLFRPFVFVSPYVSFALQKGADLEDQEWDNINRFNYGVGAGVGLDIWKLQIVGKYNWGLGRLESATNTTWAQKYENAKLQGFHLSIALMF